METVTSAELGQVTIARKRKKKMTKHQLYLLVLTLPFVLFVLLFSYVPLAGWILAFFDYQPGIPLEQTPFVGLQYFGEVFNQWFIFKPVLIATLALSFLAIATTPLPVAFAILISEVNRKWFQKFVQTFTTLPYFVSWIIVFALFYSLFSMDGMVNTLLLKLGIINQPMDPLSNVTQAWLIQTALGVWKGLGYSAIIYLAAIAGIDPELYDAAKVDGAGRWATIRHITLPGIYNTYFVLLLLGIGNILSNGFEQFYVFNNPIVQDKLQVLDVFIYNTGIISQNIPYATALGIWKSAIGITLLFLANMLSKRVRGSSIF